MRPTLFAVVLAALIPAAAQAQTGVVRGVVYDSLRGAPLSAARVMVRGTALGVTTNAAGQFVLDSVPVGRRALFVEHPALDSIGLSNLATVVDVSATRERVVALAIPSLRTMQRAACGAVLAGRDSGVVYGRLIDVHSRERLANARVLVSWLAARNTSAGVEIERPQQDVRSDSVGNYYLCAVPSDLFLSIRASDGRHETGVTEVLVGPRHIARHDLALSRAATTTFDTTSGLNRGRAVLTGVVRDGDGRPRPSARIAVDDAAGEAYADSAGRFFLRSLPAGSQMVMARAIGFSTARAMVELRDDDTAFVELSMRAINVMDTIRVTSSRSAIAQLDEIDQREAAGHGHRLKEPQLRNMTNMRAALQNLPNMTIEGPSSYRFELLTRTTNGYCRPRLYIDGMKSDIEALNSYRPEQLITVEFFPRRSDVPIRYTEADNVCGVVLVWTRFIR